MEDNDVDLQQKKRARRRLIGAIFFVSVVALVLPMVMDQEPRQQVQDVEIRIPGQDDKPFAPRLAEAPAEQPASTPGETKPAEKVIAEPAPANDLAKPVAPLVPNVKVTEVVREQKSGEKPAEKTPEKMVEKAAPAEKVAEKPSPRQEKAAVPEKKSPEVKKDEKPSVKVVEKSESKAESKLEKPKSEDARRAAALLAGGGDDPKPAAKGEYLVAIGSFANEGNVKVLKAKLGELGIRTMTEQVTTADGKKIRVRAGPFASRDAADKALARMKTIGVSGAVAAKL